MCQCSKVKIPVLSTPPESTNQWIHYITGCILFSPTCISTYQPHANSLAAQLSSQAFRRQKFATAATERSVWFCLRNLLLASQIKCSALHLLLQTPLVSFSLCLIDWFQSDLNILDNAFKPNAKSGTEKHVNNTPNVSMCRKTDKYSKDPSSPPYQYQKT